MLNRNNCPIRKKEYLERAAKSYIQTLGVSILMLQQYFFGKAVSYALTYGATRETAEKIGYDAVKNINWANIAGREDFLLKLRDNENHAKRFEKYRLMALNGGDVKELRKDLIKDHIEFSELEIVRNHNVINRLRGSKKINLQYSDYPDGLKPEFVREIADSLGITLEKEPVTVKRKSMTVKVDDKGLIQGIGTVSSVEGLKINTSMVTTQGDSYPLERENTTYLGVKTTEMIIQKHLNEGRTVTIQQNGDIVIK